MFDNLAPENLISSASNLAGTTAVKFLNSMSSGQRYYITALSAVNQHATADNVVKLLTGTRILWYLAADDEAGNCTMVFNPPLRGDDAQSISLQLQSASSEAFVNVSGFIAR